MGKKFGSFIIAFSLVAAVALPKTTTFAATTTPNTTIGITYDGHVQSYGWQKTSAADGAEAGTEGKSLRLEATKLKLTGTLPAGSSVQYKAHVQDIGWESIWSADGAIAGTVGKSKRMEAIQIKLVNLPGYTVKYRVHVQNIGWMPWVSNGDIAGTTGQSKRIEALEVVITKDLSVIDIK